MKKKLLFFFVFGLLLGCGRVGAYEYTSGGISYKQVGTDSYLVTLTLIYTCSTVSPPSTNIIDVGSKTKKTTITVKRISKIDVTPTCRSQCKKCNSSSSCSYPYGYLKYSYQGLFIASYFPKKDCDLTLSYNECCRSGAITTGGQSGGVYIESKLNQCLRKSNSSPSSNEISALLFYKDQCITQPLNFTEIDGDSLVYLLAKPLNSVGTPLPYSSPYKFSLPIKFSSWPKANTSWFPPNCEGFHLDTFTGLLQFKPTKTDYSVFAVRVEEWRDTSKMGTGKKVKIGDITKDYSIIILNYITNNVPIISGINITPFTDYFVKAGDTAKFTLTTYDADKKDSVTLVMDSSKTSAKFTTFGLPHPTGKFVWATKKSFASKKPYIFNFHAKDSACPITGYAARTINVYVLDSASLPVYKLTDTSKGCGDHTLIMKSSNPIVPTLFTWIINNKDTFYGDSVLRYHFPKTGTYTIHAIGNNYFPFVIKHYYDTINIPYLFKADCGKDTTICFGDSFKINAIGGKYSYWLPSFGMSSSTILQPIFKPTFDTKYTLYSSDSIGCKDTDDIIIRVSKPTLNLYSKSIKLCGGDSSQINISYISQIKWVPKNGIVFYPTMLIAHSDSSRNYAFTAFDSLGCTSQTDTLHVLRLNSSPYTITYLASEDALMVTKKASDYQWYYANKSIKNGISQKLRPDSNGTYSVVVTDSNGCMDTAKFVFIRTGIQEISTKPILKIYPNPTHSILNVETNATNYQIKIINTLGMKIYAETNAKEINTSLLPKGVYLLLVTTSDGNVASKVFMKE